ncbi:MAG: ATP-binding cassette domain-containing protein [Deltaproteobacteria bacterium]|nr:ATP-binding cassette domain-containing protein [Deltaproteobacteria bacterium]
MSNKELPIIETSEIFHAYNGKKVLDIKPLSFTRGKVYAVLGPNGSGKTTLLYILGLLLKPTSGNVLFEGKDVYANKGLINNVRPCLKMVRLEGFQKRKAKELSGGEAQRVTIARALAIRPEVLFLDEFTSNVDERSIEVLEEVIKNENQLHGSTIFLVTHDTHQAYKLADKVINLFEGKVVDSSLENLFRGRIIKTNNLSSFDTGKIKIDVLTDREDIAYAAINPHDIVISLKTLSSSARNSFLGTIDKIIDFGSSVRLNVKAGEELKVEITKNSFTEMKLSIGSKVYLSFKSTAVEIF